jgi:CDP-diacylglycerol--glycerol-3-phosphate 3-phosphatidyltransferase
VNGPNVLSLGRILLAAPVFLALRSGPGAMAVAVLAVALLTDFLDGWWARRSRQTTELGRLLDPLADKVLVAAALVALIQNGLVSRELGVVVVVRDLVLLGVTSMRFRHGLRIPEATRLGKVAFAALGIYLVGVTVGVRWPGGVAAAVGALYAVAGLVYARRLSRLSFGRLLKEER